MDVVVASTEADHRAVEAVRAHHAELAGALSVRVAAVHAAARQSIDPGAAREEVVRWTSRELLPHAAAEETSLYAAAGALSEGRLLVEALVADHGVIRGLVEELSEARDAVAASASAAALEAVFAVHVEKENEQVLPLLAGRSDVALADLLDGMHDELVGSPDDHEATGAASASGCGGNCTCGEQDAQTDVELDARGVPHAIRHSTIFGALDGLPEGKVMVLVAPHDPLPLLAQLEQRSPGAFEIGYDERGPEAWRLRFRRRATASA